MAEEHIKINQVPTKMKYTGNGSTREFPTVFAFFENDNVVVYKNGEIISEGYSVTGAGETDGGSVIFDTAPAEGDKIVILRNVAVERVTDFQEGGTFRAKNINDELDRQTAFCQQIQEEISRCLKVEVTDDQTPEELLAAAHEDATVAAESARVARVWATGEDAEVHEIEADEHSSRGYADLAMAIANTPEDVPVDISTLLALDVIKGPKGDKGDSWADGETVLVPTPAADDNSRKAVNSEWVINLLTEKGLI